MENMYAYYTQHRSPRPYELQSGDIIFISAKLVEHALGKHKGHLFERVTFTEGNVHGMIHKIYWSDKKWWQFWKKKEFIGCDVLILLQDGECEEKYEVSKLL